MTAPWISLPWASAVLSRLPARPEEIAEQVATGLYLPDEPVIELVELLLRALDAGLALGEPRLVADQLRWQRTRLRLVAPRIDGEVLVAAARAAIAGSLEPAASTAVDDMLTAAAAAEPSCEDDPLPVDLGPTAAAYLDRLLAWDRPGALAVVTDAVAAGADPAALLLEALQPAQTEIGRRWEAGEVTVAHEHFGTAVTRLALALLHPHLTARSPGRGRTAMAVGVGPERHDIGLRIVADLLEGDGWRTTYLGSGVPTRDTVAQVAVARPDVLAISATMPGHLGPVRSLIAEIRRQPGCERLRVVVGGRPFTVAAGLAARVGADGTAADGAAAVALCNDLCNDLCDDLVPAP